MNNNFTDIVFDGPSSNDPPHFVEAENHLGHGVRIGQWLQRPDGYWVLRIPTYQGTVMPDPEVLDVHWECDCIPDEGPTHCHACSHLEGRIVTWAESFHAPIRSAEEVRRLAYGMDMVGEDSFHGLVRDGMVTPEFITKLLDIARYVQPTPTSGT